MAPRCGQQAQARVSSAKAYTQGAGTHHSALLPRLEKCSKPSHVAPQRSRDSLAAEREGLCSDAVFCLASARVSSSTQRRGYMSCAVCITRTRCPHDLLRCLATSKQRLSRANASSCSCTRKNGRKHAAPSSTRVDGCGPVLQAFACASRPCFCSSVASQASRRLLGVGLCRGGAARASN